ncbi:helix-turn-helix transcriptional regulator [Solirubrobacter pauli]|uniref:helix-turn-helix transcriptional regulator n=1 Tax=Solirubrobacter pauli TaxID=166793 RepID=UPI0014772373|nr:LuxR C-terminal-related transcriptional regulator [Solirubrobacter pauli]
MDGLTAALALSGWVALGSFVLAVANSQSDDGLGEHPVRRITLGVLLLGFFVFALWKRRAVWAALTRRPELVVVLAAAQIAAVAADEVVGGAYVAVSLTSLGLAVLAADDRLVWACVAVLEVGFVVGLLSRYSLAELADDGELGGVVSSIVKFPVVAFMLLAIRRLFNRFSDGAGEMLMLLRAGAPALTPALDQAVASRGAPLLLGPGEPQPIVIDLTPAEVRAVEGLAAGRAPKQIAFDQGVTLATIRTHLKHAKRKTGARTLRELAAFVARPDWPRVTR